MRSHLLAVVSILTICLGGLEARGETFRLQSGGHLAGTWLNQQTPPPELYEIELDLGGRIKIPAGQIAEVVVQSEALRAYEEALPLVPNTVAGHWDMSERCRKAGLKSQRETHLKKILELDPNHAEARRGLGFSQIDGQWVKADEWLKNQGFVRYKGGWRLAQEVEIESREERRSIEQKEWRKRLKVWRAAVVRGRNDAPQALAQLKAIDDPLAIAGLAELLATPDEPNQMKVLYIDVLGKFAHSAAVTALLERVMKDPELEIRERSIEATKAHGGQQALAVLTHGLQNKDNDLVNHSAWALGQLGDPAAIPALIDAVVTKHRFKVTTGNGPGGISGGFSPQGGGGLQAGGSTKIIEKELPNRQVLNALVTLVPEGVNFAYDKQAWKDWYARKQLAPNVNLRRDQ